MGAFANSSSAVVSPAQIDSKYAAGENENSAEGTKPSIPSKQSIFGIFHVAASSKIATLFTHHDYMNFHKILGFSCLAHYLARFFSLAVYGDMFLRYDSWITWTAPAAHLLLSCSSFIFPVPLHRFGAKPIIWKELQIHNIIFTFRSAAVFYLQLLRPLFSDQSNESSSEHFLTRLLIVLICHYAADRTTDKLQDRGRTTTRDMPWDEGTSEWLKMAVKKYYAVCQVTASCALLCQQGNTKGQGVLEGSFAIMFPIQLSTFLMTLVRKNIITGTQWHFWYSLSLGAVYLIPFTEAMRSLNVEEVIATPIAESDVFVLVSRLLLAPAACLLRLYLGLDKFLVMVFPIKLSICNRMGRHQALFKFEREDIHT